MVTEADKTPFNGLDTLVFRCPECGHGKTLVASASVVVRGRVLDDATIDIHDCEVNDQDGPDLADIECERHPDAQIEACWRKRGVWMPAAEMNLS